MAQASTMLKIVGSVMLVEFMKSIGTAFLWGLWVIWLFGAVDKLVKSTEKLQLSGKLISFAFG